MEGALGQRLRGPDHQRRDAYRPVGRHHGAGSQVLIVEQDLHRSGVRPLRVLDVAIHGVEGRAEADAHEARAIGGRDLRGPFVFIGQRLHGYRPLRLAAQADGDFGEPAWRQRRRLDLPPNGLAGGDQPLEVSLRQLREMEAGRPQVVRLLVAEGDGIREAYALELHVGDRDGVGGAVPDIDLNVGAQRHVRGGVLQGFPVFVLKRPTFRPEVEELRERNVGAVGTACHVGRRSRQPRMGGEQRHEDSNLLQTHKPIGRTTKYTKGIGKAGLGFTERRRDRRA